LLLLLLFTKEKKEGDTKENQFLRKIILSIGNHERDDGKKPKRPTECARTTNGPGRVREGEDNATLRQN